VTVEVKEACLYSAYYELLVSGRSGMARVNKDHTVFTSHPHVYPQVEQTIPTFTPHPQSVTAFWTVLIFRSAEGRRLSRPR